MSTHYILLASLICACLGVSGCHSAPSGAEAENKVQTAHKDAAELDRLFAEAAVRFTKVERNGEVYYCQRSRPMGSNISRLKCMTEAQLRVEVETMSQVRDDMRNKMGKCTLGRSGQGGPCGAY